MKILFHILLLFLSLNSFAQNNKRIEILNADNTFANTEKHPEYWRLIGNVSFKHNNTIMFCDSAYHFTVQDKIKAFGKIMINQGDSISLTGNILTYFGSNNTANIKGNVKLIDQYMQLETNQIIYNLNTNIAHYPFKGTITNNKKIIKSNKGEYYANIQKFIFQDSVEVIGEDYHISTDNMHYSSNNETAFFYGPSYIYSENKTMYCEHGWYNTKTDIGKLNRESYIKTKKYILKGDSLYYEKKIGYGKAISNVHLIDTLENITISGGIAEYFEKLKKITITKKPILQLLDREKRDTLFMHAGIFISEQQINKKRILAYDKVKFFKKNLQGKCDSLVYTFNDSLIRMFKQPVLWSNEFQITADSLTCIINQSKIKQIFLKSQPMIISQEDSLDYNQIKGKSMVAFFKLNEIKKIDITGNGQSIFIIKNEKEEKIGLNYIESSDLSLSFQSNKLNDITYHTKPNSITTPYNKIEEKDRYLKGFLWRGTERPKRKQDILIGQF